MTNDHDDFWRTSGLDSGTTTSHVPGMQGGNQKKPKQQAGKSGELTYSETHE
jgi:hypothetical protein